MPKNYWCRANAIVSSKLQPLLSNKKREIDALGDYNFIST